MTILGSGSVYEKELVSSTGTFLFGYDGSITTSSGNEVFNTVVNDGGALFELGGIAFNTVVNSGGSEGVDSGGVSISATVNNGGTEYVLPSGSEAYAVVRGGGLEIVFAGGQTVGDQLLGNGPGSFATEILSGGTAFNTAISSTGLLLVSSGGIAYSTIVTSTNLGLPLNGALKVVSGGTAYSAVINAGGIENVSSGGKDFGATINNGGFLGVFAGGTESGATVSNGGLMIVSSGGVANSTQLYAGGPTTGEVVSSGGQTFGETIYLGGAESVRAGGVSHDLTVFSGGVQNLGLSNRAGGVASNTAVESGGLLVVFSGGVASNAILHGLMVVSSGGTASGTQIYASGSSGGLAGGEVVSSGAATYSETIHAGGAESVRSGGLAFNETVLRGGTLDLGLDPLLAQQFGVPDPLGGVASNTTVESGGRFVVRTAGVAVDTTINGGGLEVVSSGGTTGNTFINGGMLELARGATANGSISFGPGTLSVPSILQIDDTTGLTTDQSSHGVIKFADLNGTIDLADVSFADGGSAYIKPVTSDGKSFPVLEVEGGGASGKTVDIYLDPSFDYSKVSIKLSPDGHNGTDINLKPGLSINVTYDETVDSMTDPSRFKDGINHAVTFLEDLFTNPVTINIVVGSGVLPVGNREKVDSGGRNRASPVVVSYSQISDALNGTQPVQVQADSTLPAADDPTNPFASKNFVVPVANAQALKLKDVNGVPIARNNGVHLTAGLVLERPLKGRPSIPLHYMRSPRLWGEWER